jgi:hypothetical protein
LRSFHHAVLLQTALRSFQWLQSQGEGVVAEVKAAEQRKAELQAKGASATAQEVAAATAAVAAAKAREAGLGFKPDKVDRFVKHLSSGFDTFSFELSCKSFGL